MGRHGGSLTLRGVPQDIRRSGRPSSGRRLIRGLVGIWDAHWFSHRSFCSRYGQLSVTAHEIGSIALGGRTARPAVRSPAGLARHLIGDAAKAGSQEGEVDMAGAGVRAGGRAGQRCGGPRIALRTLLGGMLVPAATSAAMAQEPALDTGDTAWMLTSTALVLMMTVPGLALFYCGMVRKKNVLSMTMQVFATCCLVTLIWMVARLQPGVLGRGPLRRRPGAPVPGRHGGGFARAARSPRACS